MLNETSRKNDSENIWTNKIHAIVRNNNNGFFDGVTIPYKANASDQNSIELTEISKKVPRWSYNLIKEIKQVYDITDGELMLDYQIRSRKCKRVVILNDLKKIKKTSTSTIFLRM